MKPEQVLEPYLCVGFGAKAPKQSTRTIGGLASRCLFNDEAMTELGVLLHQVGTWKVIPEKDLSEARTRAKAARNELIMAAGMPYAQIVDACLEPKSEEGDAQTHADQIYKQVVFPLQSIVKQLNWS